MKPPVGEASRDRLVAWLAKTRSDCAEATGEERTGPNDLAGICPAPPMQRTTETSFQPFSDSQGFPFKLKSYSFDTCRTRIANEGKTFFPLHQHLVAVPDRDKHRRRSDRSH
jgi:hypothetical protein